MGVNRTVVAEVIEQGQNALEKAIIESAQEEPDLYKEAVRINDEIGDVQRRQSEEIVESTAASKESVAVDTLDPETLEADLETAGIGTDLLALNVEETTNLAETEADLALDIDSTTESDKNGELLLTSEIIPELATQQQFAEYVESPRETPNIETVIETAPEKPLNEVLTNIAVYLEQAPKEGLSALTPVIEKLQELFTEEFVEELEAGNLEMTPQLHEALVEILELLEYPEPQAILQSYIDELGTKEALAIMVYVSRLARAYDAQEGSSLSVGLTSQDRLSGHIGKALMSLIRPNMLESAA